MSIPAALTTYIQNINASARFFIRAKTYDIDNLSKGDLQELLKRVDNELSPENLTCDGELRGVGLKAKHDRLIAIRKALTEALNE